MSALLQLVTGGCLVVLSALAFGAAVGAQDYPSSRVGIIVNVSPGGVDA